MSIREKAGRFITVTMVIIIAWQTFLGVGQVMGAGSHQSYRLSTLDNPKSLIPIESREYYSVLTEDKIGFSYILFVTAVGVLAMMVALLVGRLIANSRFWKRQMRWLWKVLFLLGIWWVITKVLETFIKDPGAALLVGLLGWLGIYAGYCMIVSIRRHRPGSETAPSSDQTTQPTPPRP